MISSVFKLPICSGHTGRSLAQGPAPKAKTRFLEQGPKLALGEESGKQSAAAPPGRRTGPMRCLRRDGCKRRGTAPKHVGRRIERECRCKPHRIRRISARVHQPQSEQTGDCHAPDRDAPSCTARHKCASTGRRVISRGELAKAVSDAGILRHDPSLECLVGPEMDDGQPEGIDGQLLVLYLVPEDVGDAGGPLLPPDHGLIRGVGEDLLELDQG